MAVIKITTTTDETSVVELVEAWSAHEALFARMPRNAVHVAWGNSHGARTALVELWDGRVLRLAARRA